MARRSGEAGGESDRWAPRHGACRRGAARAVRPGHRPADPGCPEPQHLCLPDRRDRRLGPGDSRRGARAGPARRASRPRASRRAGLTHPARLDSPRLDRAARRAALLAVADSCGRVEPIPAPADPRGRARRSSSPLCPVRSRPKPLPLPRLRGPDRGGRVSVHRPDPGFHLRRQPRHPGTEGRLEDAGGADRLRRVPACVAAGLAGDRSTRSGSPTSPPWRMARIGSETPRPSPTRPSRRSRRSSPAISRSPTGSPPTPTIPRTSSPCWAPPMRPTSPSRRPISARPSNARGSLR